MSLFGDDPMDKAMPYLNQAAGLFKETRNQGRSAYGVINPISTSMAQDPAAYLESLMKSYQPSRNYQLREQEGRRALGNTAAAGGVRGTLNDLQNESRLTDSLLGEDMQQWLQNVLGIQGQGLGAQQNFYNAGQQATSDLSNVYGSQGTLAFQNQANNNKEFGDILNGLIGAAGAVGGGLLGAPAGGLAAKWFLGGK